MMNIIYLGLMGMLMLWGCMGHQVSDGKLADLYLSTLDDKHFVWCTLDVEQCRTDFEAWKQTERGRMLQAELLNGSAHEVYNTHKFVDVLEPKPMRIQTDRYGPELPHEIGSMKTIRSRTVQ